ncbi:hypothetical protein BC936DRAFT_145857 [Jimgerdemannia flammicorona]|uniref:GH18 domain-containing protein n=1 Tax=Jimgerdemannia flammicorona TaxID=994334 RepID=A0A433D8Y0_9FUNG|nr:hypothetical protein BC936DRAFT_145857 [Jimgerdemannia flammicorona]
MFIKASFALQPPQPCWPVSSPQILPSTFNFSLLSHQPNCNDNVVVYWGQDSYGIQNSSDKANWEQDLEYYCTDSTADVINVSFLITVSDTQGKKELDFGLVTDFRPENLTTFPSSALLNCPKVGQDIKTCQAAGKKTLLSVGGAADYRAPPRPTRLP